MARDTSVLESAAMFWARATRPLMNQHGEVAIQQPAADTQVSATPAQPGASADVKLPGDEYSPSLDLLPVSSTDNPNVDPTQQVSQDGAPPAVALNPDTAPAQSADGQQTASDKGPIPYERFKEVNDQVATFRGELENVKHMAEFYQTQYNELVAQTQGGQQPPAQSAAINPATPGPATSAAKEQLPAGIKGPEEWETQGDMAAYFDHIATAKAQPLVRQEIEGVYKSAIAPQMQAINKWVGALEEMVVRAQHPDFDEVTRAVMSELFVTDHEGNIWNDPSGNPKVKNQALLNYIRQAPSPRMALYNYGAAKKAPDIKATAVKETTENLLKALDTKPRGPTMPKQSGGAIDTDEVPSQNAPKEVVDAWLKRKGFA